MALSTKEILRKGEWLKDNITAVFAYSAQTLNQEFFFSFKNDNSRKIHSSQWPQSGARFVLLQTYLYSFYIYDTILNALIDVGAFIQRLAQVLKDLGCIFGLVDVSDPQLRLAKNKSKKTREI